MVLDSKPYGVGTQSQIRDGEQVATYDFRSSLCVYQSPPNGASGRKPGTDRSREPAGVIRLVQT